MNSHVLRLGRRRVIESPEVRHYADWPAMSYVYRWKGKFTLTRMSVGALPWGMVTGVPSQTRREIAKFASPRERDYALGRTK